MSSMKCTIPGVNLKVFGRAIQSLSKIGDELYLEPLEDGLFLRSVNSSRSAYGCFQFSPSFFDHYIDGVTDKGNNSDNDDAVLRCKLGMKSVIAVFKSLSTIDKTVEKCRISLDTAESRLVFQMYCRHGIIKTHKLAFTECETLQAVFSKDMCPNKLTAVPKLLCDAVLNFQNNQEEITLIIRPNFMALKNYVDDEPDTNKIVHTELTLSPEEFEQYQAGVDADVTFCLKELRAVLAFADITSLPITLQFESAGRPITFSITSDLSFEANFVLATLAEVESSETSTGTRARPSMSHSAGYNKRGGTAGKQNFVHNGRDSINRNSSNINGRYTERAKNFTNTSSQSRNPPVHSTSLRDKAGPSSAVDEMMDDDDDELSLMLDVTAPEESYTSQPHKATSDKNISEEVSLDGRKDLQNEIDEEGDYSGWNTELRTARNIFNTKLATSRETEFQKSNDKKSSVDETTQNSQSKQNQLSHSEALQKSSSSNSSHNLHLTNQKYLSLKSAKSNSGDTSPVIPMQNANLSLQDESEDEEEEIPVTPPSKKFRSIFFGTQSSTQSTQSQQKSAVLAPDSEEDD